jgi:PTS system fructose-specific IIC component
MTEQLPPAARSLFEKLHKRYRLAIVPIGEGICAACGMRLTVSQIQAVRLAREIQTCPNCAHMLCDTRSSPRRTGRTPRRSEPRKGGIARFSAHTLMVPNLVSTDKEGAVRELATKMEKEGFIDDAGKLVESVMRREAIASTALEHGLAVPHARAVEGGGLTLAMGISRQGIRFGSESDPLSKFIFLIAIPTAASAFYLKLLAGLAETFMQAEHRKAILAEKEPDKLWKALVKATRIAIK